MKGEISNVGTRNPKPMGPEIGGLPTTVGSGTAGPPFVLLDGNVRLDPVPEPATWTEVGVSLLSVVGFAYRRRKSVCVPDKAEDA